MSLLASNPILHFTGIPYETTKRTPNQILENLLPIFSSGTHREINPLNFL